MKKVGIYTLVILIITIILPAIIVKTFNFAPTGDGLQSNVANPKVINKEVKEEAEFDGYIAVYDTRNQEVHKIALEEYVKGVVAAEMPAGLLLLVELQISLKVIQTIWRLLFVQAFTVSPILI